jgi:hypothetical protein
MYLFQKPCIALGSITKEGLDDFRFLSRTILEAHTVFVENEMWIFVRVILSVDVRFSNSIMSDINGGLQTFQR